MNGVFDNVADLMIDVAREGGEPGFDRPKVIDAAVTEDCAVEDLVANRLHVLHAETGDRAAAIVALENELDGMLDRAIRSFAGEANRDDFCPEGVKVINLRGGN